jgi:hypothetical protein
MAVPALTGSPISAAVSRARSNISRHRSTSADPGGVSPCKIQWVAMISRLPIRSAIAC